VADPSRVEDLRPGDHACLTFSDSEERLDIVAAFVRDGLRQGQRILCITDSVPEALLREQLRRRGLPVNQATQAGQLTVAASTEGYLTDGSFSASRAIGMLGGHMLRARRDGYRGLRVTGDMCWALRPIAGVAELMTYEESFTDLLADEKATAVCQYDRQCFDTVTLAGVAAAHAVGVAAVTYHDDALLRLCRQHVPSGLRAAGEIDYRAVDSLTRALVEALALDEHVHVNMSRLHFIDAAAAGALLQAALSMGDAQRMTVHCPPLVHRVLAALGADGIPRLRLVVGDDD
jgi:anti-anti-sigma regulatory factor